MKIAILRPSMLGKPTGDAMMPLIFGILKALTPNGVELAFYDEMIERVPDLPDVDAVAMTVETFSARRAYALAAKWRAQGKRVVMGGYHPSMLPDECMQHADAVVVGEAEDTWPDIVRDLADGRLKRIYKSACNGAIGRVDYAVFDGKRYPLIAPVQFGRGCRFDCEFCSVHAFFGDVIRTKPVDDFIRELRGIRRKYLFFVDDNLFADATRLGELLDGLAPLGVKWICQVSIDVAQDEALLMRMKRSGCIMVLIGFESLVPESLRRMGKRANLQCDYRRAIANLRRAGLMIYGTFIFGYDADAPESMRATVDFAVRHGFAIANFNPLMPMPGTRLFSRLQTEKRLSHGEWWLDAGYRYGDAMLSPAAMTPEQLAAGALNARYAFHSLGSIARRFVGARANRRHPLIYWVANLVSRGAIRQKQGARLGGEDA